VKFSKLSLLFRTENVKSFLLPDLLERVEHDYNAAEAYYSRVPEIFYRDKDSQFMHSRSPVNDLTLIKFGNRRLRLVASIH